MGKSHYCSRKCEDKRECQCSPCEKVKVIKELPYLITKPGTYCLCKDFNYAGADPAIAVLSDNVVLNFNTKKITLTAPNTLAVLVNGSKDVTLNDVHVVGQVDSNPDNTYQGINVLISKDVSINRAVLCNLEFWALLVQESDGVIVDCSYIFNDEIFRFGINIENSVNYRLLNTQSTNAHNRVSKSINGEIVNLQSFADTNFFSFPHLFINHIGTEIENLSNVFLSDFDLYSTPAVGGFQTGVLFSGNNVTIEKGKVVLQAFQYALGISSGPLFSLNDEISSRNVTIKDNEVILNGVGEGISVYGIDFTNQRAENILIENNQVSNSSIGIATADFPGAGSGLSVRGVQLKNNQTYNCGTGLDLKLVEGFVVTGNQNTSSRESGVILKGCKNGLVRENTSSSSGVYGFAAGSLNTFESSAIIFKDNTAINNAVGYSDQGVIVDPDYFPSKNTLFEANRAVCNGTNFDYVDLTTVLINNIETAQKGLPAVQSVAEKSVKPDILKLAAEAREKYEARKN